MKCDYKKLLTQILSRWLSWYCLDRIFFLISAEKPSRAKIYWMEYRLFRRVVWPIKSFSSLTCISRSAKFTEASIPSRYDCATWQRLTNFNIVSFTRHVKKDFNTWKNSASGCKNLFAFVNVGKIAWKRRSYTSVQGSTNRSRKLLNLSCLQFFDRK